MILKWVVFKYMILINVNQYIYYSFDRNRIDRDLFQITSSYWSDKILEYISKTMNQAGEWAGNYCKI